MKKINMVGEKFGKLTVLCEAPPEEKRKYDSFWVCECECGGRITTGRSSLIHGQTRSCGCLAKHPKKKLNPYIFEEDVIKIILPKGGECLIDKEDFDKIKDITWNLHNGYAYGVDENGKYIGIHQRILGKKYIDHINQNKLDNRKSNLRPASIKQNCRNKKLRSDNQSGYKGVYYGTSAWIATIEDVYLGSFKTPEEAARAYDRKAIQFQKEFACLNFPEDYPDHPNRCPARRIP